MFGIIVIEFSPCALSKYLGGNAVPPNIMASTDAHRRWMTGDAQRELGAMPTRLNDLYGESKLDPLPGRTSCSQTTLQLYVATQRRTSNGRLEVSNALAPNVVLSGLA